MQVLHGGLCVDAEGLAYVEEAVHELRRAYLEVEVERPSLAAGLAEPGRPRRDGKRELPQQERLARLRGARHEELAAHAHDARYELWRELRQEPLVGDHGLWEEPRLWWAGLVFRDVGKWALEDEREGAGPPWRWLPVCVVRPKRDPVWPARKGRIRGGVRAHAATPARCRGVRRGGGGATRSRPRDGRVSSSVSPCPLPPAPRACAVAPSLRARVPGRVRPARGMRLHDEGSTRIGALADGRTRGTPPKASPSRPRFRGYVWVRFGTPGPTGGTRKVFLPQVATVEERWSETAASPTSCRPAQTRTRPKEAGR